MPFCVPHMRAGLRLAEGRSRDRGRRCWERTDARERCRQRGVEERASSKQGVEPFVAVVFCSPSLRLSRARPVQGPHCTQVQGRAGSSRPRPGGPPSSSPPAAGRAEQGGAGPSCVAHAHCHLSAGDRLTSFCMLGMQACCANKGTVHAHGQLQGRACKKKAASEGICRHSLHGLAEGSQASSPICREVAGLVCLLCPKRMCTPAHTVVANVCHAARHA